MTPTNSVWPASQDRVPSVWCCPTPHWLVNEGLCWVGWVGLSGRGSRGGRGVGDSLCSPPSDQLLIHSSFATTTNRGHTRGRAVVQSRPIGTVWGTGTPPPQRSISTLSLRKQSCLYWTRTEKSTFFSFPPFPLSITTSIICPALLLPPPPLHPSVPSSFLSSILLLLLFLSPASLSGTNQQLSQRHSEQVYFLQNEPLFSGCSYLSGSKR